MSVREHRTAQSGPTDASGQPEHQLAERRDALRVRDLLVTYQGRPAVEIPDLAVRWGEVFAVLGPNGAGKSTLLRVLALLETPARGRRWALGTEVTSRTDVLSLRRQMAVVFQEPLLFDDTVAANAGLGLTLRGISRKERERRVGHMLERLGVAHLARRSALALSGGEAQRVALARALVVEPKVLLLDEPFASLDAPTREGILVDLQHLLVETRTTVVFVTHHRDEALHLADRIAVLMDGHVRQVGATAEVFRHPTSVEVARFLGMESVVMGEVVDASNGLVQVRIGQRVLVSASVQRPSGPVAVCVRAEDVVLDTAPQADATNGDAVPNRLVGRITRLAPSGPHLKVHLDVGFPLVAFVTGRSERDPMLAVGRQVVARVAATSVHVIPIHQGQYPA